MLKISLAAEEIIKIGNFPITNSLITTWVVMIFLIIISVLATRKLNKVPSKFQSIIELLIGGLYDLFSSLVGKHTNRLYPLVASYFIFIVFSNWFGLLPGVGTFGVYKAPHAKETVKEEAVSETKELVKVETAVEEAAHDAVKTETKEVAPIEASTNGEAAETEEEKEFVPMFRAPTADLNMTLALAIIAFFIIQYFGFAITGITYIKKFINFSNPIYFFVGFLEIVSDISKIISFAFRLFGNIFAGEVLLAVMAFLIPVFMPVPFLAMEIFVGFIQALVFAMLVSVFTNIAVSHGDHDSSDAHHKS